MAFDAVHTLRTSTHLPRPKRQVLAAWLDFAACANAAFDNKPYCPKEFQSTRQQLELAGLGPSLDAFLHEMGELEKRRPSRGTDEWEFQAVRLYREAVIRLSLGVVAAITMDTSRTDAGIRPTDCDEDVEILFRIVMQCQIIDDLLDYTEDLSCGLPSFLTAEASVARALQKTQAAAYEYADDRAVPRSRHVFPLRIALFVVSACAHLVILAARVKGSVSRRCPSPAPISRSRL